MSSTSLREQLQSLSIDGRQRPTGVARAGRRFGFGVFIILLLALGSAAYFFRDRLAPWVGAATASLSAAANKPPEVTLITVTESRSQPELGPALTASGKMVSDHQVEVATKVSGQIVALFFEQGDYVKQGQLLARIEDKIYRALRDEAAAKLSRAKAALAYQQVNWTRINSTGKMWSDIEMADVKRQLEEAQANVEAEQAALAFTQKQLDDCEVVAPIAGVVLERNVEVGDFVAAEGGRGANANAQFGAIADMEKLRVEVDVSELDINRLQKGMPCFITPDAYKDRKYSGHVLWIDPGANYAKATVQVKVRIDGADEYLRVEGSAQVQFQHEAAASQPATDQAPRIWIPAAAIGSGPNGATFVYNAENGRLRKTAVTLGERRGDQVHVVSGLHDGQQIAAGDVAKLSDGQSYK